MSLLLCKLKFPVPSTRRFRTGAWSIFWIDNSPFTRRPAMGIGRISSKLCRVRIAGEYILAAKIITSARHFHEYRQRESWLQTHVKITEALESMQRWMMPREVIVLLVCAALQSIDVIYMYNLRRLHRRQVQTLFKILTQSSSNEVFVFTSVC